jgi:hypothetical protein
MRLPVFCLALISPAVAAETPAVRYDPVEFEQRFHKADQGGKGKLTREEAYGEFQRMPEFFDHIDADGDGHITLHEVHGLVEKKIDDAIAASQARSYYGGLDAGLNTGDAPDAGAAQKRQFASDAEARHYYRNQYFESLADRKAQARERGEVVSPSPSTPFLHRSF